MQEISVGYKYRSLSCVKFLLGEGLTSLSWQPFPPPLLANFEPLMPIWGFAKAEILVSLQFMQKVNWCRLLWFYVKSGKPKSPGDLSRHYCNHSLPTFGLSSQSSLSSCQPLVPLLPKSARTPQESQPIFKCSFLLNSSSKLLPWNKALIIY